MKKSLSVEERMDSWRVEGSDSQETRSESISMVSVVGSGGSGGGVKSCSGAGLSAESVARAGSWSSKKKWLYESQPRGRLSWMGSSGTCMSRSR
eukprot:scaffold16740_cov137-Amphora_coffeaeformis.AAC.1